MGGTPAPAFIKTAYLTIISETGFPHSACLFEYPPPGLRLEWYGYQPGGVDNFILGSRGYTDIANREKNINHYVRFRVTNLALNRARQMIIDTYGVPDEVSKSHFYVAGFKDCVSLSADVARICGYPLPAMNLTPFGLVTFLRARYDYVNYDEKPYPWLEWLKESGAETPPFIE